MGQRSRTPEGAGRKGATVLVTWLGFDPDDPAGGGPLTAAGLRIRRAPKAGRRTPAEVRELARGVVAAIVSTDPFDAEVFAASPGLRIVARMGVGVDSIDLAAATRAGVAVTTTPGDNEATVADHAVALMLAVLRRLPEHDAAVREGRWERVGERTGWDLSGAVVGLVGFGRIGHQVATRLRGFGVELLACDPAARAEAGVELVPLDELLARAQVVSLHLPLQDDTRSIIGARELALMRADAVLVNTSRGALVDEAALYEALSRGRLLAAALDVFADEPPTGSPLLDLPNVVLSPHVAGPSHRSIDRMLRTATGSVLDLLRGEVPHGLVNPEVLEHPKLRHLSERPIRRCA
jgi:phosphoglycerate dehydrogenase-like enzyme